MDAAPSRKKRVLCFASYFLPGFRAGGPIRSLQRLIEALGTEFEFGVVTRDRDLGSDAPYPGCAPGRWSDVDGIRVWYLAPPFWAPGPLRRAVADFRPDLLYFHSFWDPALVAMPLALRRIGLLGPTVPSLVAPRGEFAPGALAIKGRSKSAWMSLVRTLGLYDDAIWHASTPFEAAQVHVRWGAGARVLVAADLPPRVPGGTLPPRPAKAQGSLRIVFLSRVSPMKNLDGALRMLQQVASPMSLDVYGTREDEDYWAECERAMRRLPPHVRVTYHGAVPPDRVIGILAAHDLFLLPTLGENFGHVILEALVAGCPVLISDRTPWRDLGQRRAGRELSLDDPDRFVAALEEFAAMNDARYREWSDGAARYGGEYCTDDASRTATRAVLDAAMRGT